MDEMKRPCCARHIQNGQFNAVTSGSNIVLMILSYQNVIKQQRGS